MTGLHLCFLHLLLLPPPPHTNLHSFPSGHASNSMSLAMFTSIYVIWSMYLRCGRYARVQTHSTLHNNCACIAGQLGGLLLPAALERHGAQLLKLAVQEAHPTLRLCRRALCRRSLHTHPHYRHDAPYPGTCVWHA